MFPFSPLYRYTTVLVCFLRIPHCFYCMLLLVWCCMCSGHLPCFFVVACLLPLLSLFSLSSFACSSERLQQAPVTLPPSLPFEGESSYRTEYGPKPLPPPPKASTVTVPASLPFEATTAYRTDYGPKPLPPPTKPAEIHLQPSLPFEASSSYRYTNETGAMHDVMGRRIEGLEDA